MRLPAHILWLLAGGQVCLAGPAAVTVDPPAVTLSATAGWMPLRRPITITAAEWTASAGAPWTILSQTAGTGITNITVAADTTGMIAGVYTDVVRVQSADGSSATVVVTLRLAPAGSAGGAEWHVTPDGAASGDGSPARPLDIVTALGERSPARPGDTIWLHGGKYGVGGTYATVASRLVGTKTAPIVVRAAPGERPILDAWLQVGCCDQAADPRQGAYTWFQGIEFASYDPDRRSGNSGPPDYAHQENHAAVDVWAPGTKIINCIVHDTSAGIEMWDEAVDSEAYGNLVYNVGGYGHDRGHGHGFYMQNAAPGFKHLIDNITFNNFGEGIQLFGSNDSYVQNFHLEGNVSFNNGAPGLGGSETSTAPPAGSRNDNVIIGAGKGGPRGIILIQNFLYHTPAADDGANELGYPQTPAGSDVTAIGNYFIGGSEAVNLTRWDAAVFQDNTIYVARQRETSLTWNDSQSPLRYRYDGNRYFGSGRFSVKARCNVDPCDRTELGFADWQASVGVDATSVFTAGRPPGVWTFVRRNLYEMGRANIVVYNWDLAPAVTVDLRTAGLPYGASYEIRDAQNWTARALVKGVYAGETVAIPMTGLIAAPPNGVVPNPQPHTGPQFGVFVLVRVN